MLRELDTEIATYHRELPNLLPYAGHFAVICGDKVLGIYACRHDASLIGMQQLGTDAQFLVRRISDREEAVVSHFNPELFRCDEPQAP